MKVRIEDQVSVAALLGAGVLSGVLYSRLPTRIPTHFNIHGVADGWMNRDVGTLLLPTTAFGVWILLRFGAFVLPAAWRERMKASPTPLLAALVVGLLCALQCVVLHAAIAKPPSVAAGLGLILGGFWLALGLVIPRVRRNPWMGVRTAWTLSSDESWARTHRVAGYAWVLSGVAALIAVGLGYATAAPVIVVASALAPAVYSFVLARQLPPAR